MSELDTVLREALEKLRAERAAGRFETCTLLITGRTLGREIGERLTALGATESELAAIKLWCQP